MQRGQEEISEQAVKFHGQIGIQFFGQLRTLGEQSHLISPITNWSLQLSWTYYKKLKPIGVMGVQ